MSQVGTRPDSSSAARVSAESRPRWQSTVDEALGRRIARSAAAGSDGDAVAPAEGESEGEPEGDGARRGGDSDDGSVVVEVSVGDAGVAELEPARVLDGVVVGLAGSEDGPGGRPGVGFVVGIFVGWVVPDVVGDVGAGEVVIGRWSPSVQPPGGRSVPTGSRRVPVCQASPR